MPRYYIIRYYNMNPSFPDAELNLQYETKNSGNTRNSIFRYYHFIFSFTEEWKVEDNGTFTGIKLDHSLDRFTYYPAILVVDYTFCQIY